MSQEYNLVQLNTLYLTDTGLVGGVPCRTAVAGLDALSLTKAGQTTIAADGTPYNFISDGGGKGGPIKVSPEVVSSALLATLKTLLNTAIAANTTIHAIFTGDTGTFDLNVKPLFPKPIEFNGEFFNGNIYGLVLNFTVQSIN